MKSIHCLTLAFVLGATTNGFGQATLQFTAASYSVPENAGNAVLTVLRGGDTNTAVGVDYATVDGTAIDLLTYSVAEDAGAVQIGVDRFDDGTNTVSVDFFTSDATATNGVDYTGITNTLTFGPLERQKFVSVPIINNTVKQGNRT